MVSLREHRPVAVLESLDDPDLPQGLRSIELLGHDPAYELAQFALTAGRRQSRVPDVVVDVEMRIVHPHRSPDIERDEPDNLSVARNQSQLRIDHRDDIFEEWRRSFEDRDRRDVHVTHAVLDV